MRGIALKIFLSFWLIFAVLIAIFALLPDDGASVRFVDHLRQHGIVAAGILERQGAAACSAYAAVLAQDSRVALTLLDDTGRAVCGSAPQAGAIRSTVPRPDGTVLTLAGTELPGFADLFLAPPFPYGAVLLAIIVSGIVCFWMARSLARPLQDVRDASHRLAAGDLQARAGEATAARRDEIGDLGRDFNAMAGRIETLISAQGQLLSDISHELRSPLARLNVALELARRRAGDAAADDLRRIETEAERMNDLIGRVLSLARAEHDESAEFVETFELADLVRLVAEDAGFETGPQRKSVVMQVSAKPLVRGRAALVASAVDNLVRNAVRHSPAGASVTVTVDATPDAAIVQVRDHGPGVPEGELERIFEPFHRVDPGRSPQSGGVGLGLAIAKRAVTVHDGTITAENAGGGGLCVTIRLPRHEDPTAS